MIITVALATACGTEKPSNESQPPAPPASQQAPSQAGPSPDKAAPPEELRFSATTVDGKKFSGENLAGKPTVLWFWAAWCPVCERESPGVARVARANQDKVNFLGVASLSDVPKMRQFVSDNGIGSFPNVADTESSVWQRFGVTSQPAYAFIDADGTVDTVKGSLSEDELASRVEQLDSP
ncbi:MAG: redoxin domain-containing protein [Pseudonocardiaceae bacterium]|nr:redoxin domain-containing protein [Pseudonocardiaceae bacterium]